MICAGCYRDWLKCLRFFPESPLLILFLHSSPCLSLFPLHSCPHLCSVPLFGSVPFIASSPVYSVIVLLVASRSLLLFVFLLSLSSLFFPSYFSPLLLSNTFFSFFCFIFSPVPSYVPSPSSQFIFQSPSHHSSHYIIHYHLFCLSLSLSFPAAYSHLHPLSAFLSVTSLLYFAFPLLSSFFSRTLLFCSFPILRSKINSSVTIHFLLYQRFRHTNRKWNYSWALRRTSPPSL